ncbi:MAG: FkbM family methyltransferase [Cyclobacteriaceae bacterium]
MQEKILCRIFDRDRPFIFFDIGACEGLSSVRYSRLFPKSTIYAFEPVPRNYQTVLENKEKYGLEDMEVFQMALSSQKGSSRLHLSSGRPEHVSKDDMIDYGNKSSSLLEPERHLEIYPWLKFEEKIVVSTDTLDHFCSEHGVSVIDFIHMDVQGAELMVLESGKSTLRNVKSIWLEVGKVELYRGQPLKREVESFLEEQGWIKVISTVGKISGDQFWVNKAFAKNMNASKRFLLLLYRMKAFLNDLLR